MQPKPQPLYWCPKCRKAQVTAEGKLCDRCAALVATEAALQTELAETEAKLADVEAKAQ